MDPSVAPVLKWVGGKRQVLDVLIPMLPQNISTYCEPFVGGGAMLFKLQPAKAYVNDINTDLIRVYDIIKNDVEALISALQEFKNEAGFYYAVREWDRNKAKYSSLSDIKKAARTIYLNKTCYNGLFRVNSAGEFNSPFGNYRNPNIVNAYTLRAVSSYLNSATICLTSNDYAHFLQNIQNLFLKQKDTFVYLDPPYDPVSDTSNFTGYTKGGFSRQEQVRLKECCDQLHKQKFKFMLSNSATEFIKELYANYHITIVRAKRAINSNAKKRGEVDEVVIRNYI